MLEEPGWLGDAFMSALTASLIAFLVSWIVFARVSVAKIERKMRRDGLPKPSRWDRLGTRVPGYALTIAFGWTDLGNPASYPPLTRQYATRADLGLAWIYLATFSLLGVLALIGVLFFEIGR